MLSCEFCETPINTLSLNNISGGCFHTEIKNSLIFSVISSMHNCKTKLWKEMEIRVGRKGKIWMQVTLQVFFEGIFSFSYSFNHKRSWKLYKPLNCVILFFQLRLECERFISSNGQCFQVHLGKEHP